MKNYIKTILCISIFMLVLKVNSQDSRKTIDKIYYELLKDSVLLDSSYTIGSIKYIKKDLLEYLLLIRKQEEIQNTFTGKLNFGIENNDSKDLEITRIDVGVHLKRGTFPGEFKFDSNVNLQLRDTKLVENLSTLGMSYDHHFSNKLDYEGYGFIKRSSNDYLNINQRYEVGIGIVRNIYLSGKKYKKVTENNRLTKVGKEEYDTFYKKDKDINIDNLTICNDTICQLIQFNEKEKKAFRTSSERALQSLRKRKSRIRISVLAGINYEIEKTNDSVKLYNNSLNPKKNNFDPTNLVRFVLGPNLDLNINELTFNTRAYLKLGISEGELNDKVIFNNLRSTKTNYRIEWSTTASVKLTSKIGFRGTFLYEYINAPKREYFDASVNNQPVNIQLFSAADRFTKFTLGLTYEL